MSDSKKTSEPQRPDTAKPNLVSELRQNQHKSTAKPNLVSELRQNQHKSTAKPNLVQESPAKSAQDFSAARPFLTMLSTENK